MRCADLVPLPAVKCAAPVFRWAIALLSAASLVVSKPRTRLLQIDQLLRRAGAPENAVAMRKAPELLDHLEMYAAAAILGGDRVALLPPIIVLVIWMWRMVLIKRLHV